jgi:hypothetical protein
VYDDLGCMVYIGTKLLGLDIEIRVQDQHRQRQRLTATATPDIENKLEATPNPKP